ncbi:MAG: hypothetical protein ACFE0P_08505 [Oceanicaulis sp.]
MQQTNDFEHDGFELADGSRVAVKRHMNSDGTAGGWIPADMTLDDSVYLGPGVIVFPGVVLSENVRIEGPCVVAVE